MVFKVVGDSSPTEVGQLWVSPYTHSENNYDALNINTTYPGHYKNRIVLDWQTFQPQQVRNYLEYISQICEICPEMQGVTKMADLTKFRQTGNFLQITSPELGLNMLANLTNSDISVHK